uniref:Uncharacterized protein n=1 Tax=Rhizophora mucronata TaxID=61149 RepID=A0A2P2IMY9_RHIMU
MWGRKIGFVFMRIIMSSFSFDSMFHQFLISFDFLQFLKSNRPEMRPVPSFSGQTS